MNRTPPVPVRRALRQEVGFGCPVQDCGNPYLSWHHFDPPWSEREHHDPPGMIALCAEHHSKADAGAFDKEQLRQLKRDPFAKGRAVKGRFDWLRNELLLVVGGMFYLRTPIAVQVGGRPIVSTTRDSDGHALLNVNMLSTSGRPRMVMVESYWLSHGEPDDLECPPNGRLVAASYPGGDLLRVEFFKLADAAAVRERYPDASWPLPVPINAVEIRMRVGGTEIDFGPRESRLPGGNIFPNGLIRDCPVGLAIQ